MSSQLLFLRQIVYVVRRGKIAFVSLGGAATAIKQEKPEFSSGFVCDLI